MAGGRAPRTLLERVLENSFRPARYGELLAEALPDEIPAELGARFAAGYRGRVWTELLELQEEWRHWEKLAVDDPGYPTLRRDELASEFSAIVGHLHYRAAPKKWREWLEEQLDERQLVRLGVPW